MSMKQVKLESHTIKAIESTLAKGERVEIIPVKDGVKVVRVKRQTIES
jgi:flagellar biogenesis protein FliO